MATFNSEPLLADCLGSIRSQLIEDRVELIVVDGGSTDGTLRLASESADLVLHNPAKTELGFSGGKNLGLASARGEFVAMVDADNTLVGVNYLSLLRHALQREPEVKAAMPIPWIPIRGSAPSLLRFFCLEERRFWDTQSRDGQRREDRVLFRPDRAIVSNAALVRRQDLLDIGGWDFDTEVGRRLLERQDSTFALVDGACRFHSEVHDYGELWRKLDRRMKTQKYRLKEKPAVLEEIQDTFRDPLSRVREELSFPLALGIRSRDLVYLHALPVFALKSLLFLARGLWLRPASQRGLQSSQDSY